MKAKLNAKCGCGSGLKFKKCCWKTIQFDRAKQIEDARKGVPIHKQKSIIWHSPVPGSDDEREMNRRKEQRAMARHIEMERLLRSQKNAGADDDTDH